VARMQLSQKNLRIALKRALHESIDGGSNDERREGAGILFHCRTSGRVLLALRSKWVSDPGTWGLPGGGVEPGESPLEGALREAEEEIGWRGEVHARPAYQSQAMNGFRYHSFIGTLEQEFEPTINWEHERAGWFRLDDLPSPLHQGVEELMRSPEVRALPRQGPKR